MSKTRKYKVGKIRRKRKITRKRAKKKRFLYNPNNPKKSFDVYIDKNPKDTIHIKYTTVSDVKHTIKKLERLYKSKKYSHKRIWQVGMIMKVRLEAMLKHKKNKYPNAKNVWIPDEVSGLENYASDKVEENVNKLITNIYRKNVEPEDRSIWCIDSSRNKYLTRLNNLWHVDLYGLLFCKKVCKQLSKRCNEYMNEKENINIHDKMRVIAMIADLLLRKKLTGPIKGEFIVNTLEEAENVENQ